MTALLRYANYAKVARDLDVSRQTVMRWAKGMAVTPWQLRRVRELYGVDTETPPLQVEERLERIESKVDAIYERQLEVAASASRQVIEALADPERLAWVERLAAMIQAASTTPSSEGSDDPPGTGGLGGAGRGALRRE